MRSDAGPWGSREFLSAYISGYVDGEGCFTVSISPRAKLLAGWEVRPSFSVSQNGDRAEVLHVLHEHFGCRWHPARPKRQDPQVGDTAARGHPRARHPSLRAVPADLRQTSRLRALRCRLSVTGGRGA